MMKKLLYSLIALFTLAGFEVKSQITLPDEYLGFYIENGEPAEINTILDSILNDNLLEPGMNATNYLTKCNGNINTFVNPNDPSFPFKSGIVLSTAFPDSKLSPGGEEYTQVASGICPEYDELLLTIAPDISDVEDKWVNDTIFLYTDTITKWEWYNPDDAVTYTKLAINGVQTMHGVSELLWVKASLQGITILEFDFVPQGNNISFKYLFASEEYNNTETTKLDNLYNDAFGFFLHGTNPETGTEEWRNLALVPETDTPIRTRNINDSINSEYYDTGNPLTAFANFRGLTKPLTAVANVVPCETYRIQLAIGNYGGNSDLASAVFIEGKSFKSGGSVFQVNELLSQTGDTTACVEGCKNLEVLFKVPHRNVSRDTTINIILEGNANQGTDYTTVNTQVFIPAGQELGMITIEPLEDDIPNENDSILVIVPTACSQDSLTLFIQEPASLDMTAGNIDNQDLGVISIECGEDTTLYAYAVTDADVNYEWFDGDWNPIGTLDSVNVSPKTTTIYRVKASGGCSEAWDSIEVQLPPVPVTITPAANTVCPETSPELTASATVAIDNWEWFDMANPASTIGTVDLLDNYPIAAQTTFRVKGNTIDGCYGQQDITIDVYTPESVTLQTDITNATMYPGDTATIWYDVLNNPVWSGTDYNEAADGSSIEAYPTTLGSHTYEVSGEDVNGCTTTDDITLIIDSLPDPKPVIFEDTVCQGALVILVDTSSTASTIAGLRYNWSLDGGTTEDDIEGQGPLNVLWGASGTKEVELTYEYKGQSSTTTSVSVEVQPFPRADFSRDQAKGCVPFTVSMSNKTTGITENTTYLWDFGVPFYNSTEFEPMYTYEKAVKSPSGKVTSVDITLIAANGKCADTISKSVAPLPLPNTAIQADRYKVQQLDSRIAFSTLLYDDIDSTDQFTWDFGDGNTANNGLVHKHEYMEVDTFDVVMIATNAPYGCTDTNRISIVVGPEYTLYVPNSFTPQGGNPYWKFYGNNLDKMTIEVFIFDRWGNMVYTFPNADDNWDGWDGSNTSGAQCPVGAYTYRLLYDDVDGRRQEQVGTIFKLN